jgi:uncharacterized membrane protein
MYDLLFVLISSLLLLPIAELSQIPVLRIVFGVLYVGLLPGYALIAAVFPGQGDLEGLERLGLSLVFSISMVSLTAFLLALSPWGLRLSLLLLSLNLLTLLACGLAYWRRLKLPSVERSALHVGLPVPDWRQVDRTNRFLALILMLAVAAALAAMVYAIATPRSKETFTEFYLLGPDGDLSGLPTEITKGDSVTITLRVVNYEQADVRYRIKRAGDADREQITSIRLSHDESWEQPYTFTLTGPGESRNIVFLLFKEGVEEPYRSLHLWITAKEE